LHLYLQFHYVSAPGLPSTDETLKSKLGVTHSVNSCTIAEIYRPGTIFLLIVGLWFFYTASSGSVIQLKAVCYGGSKSFKVI